MVQISVPPAGPEPRALLARWLVPDGTPVVVGEPLCELETERATVEVAAPRAGILKHLAEEGAYLRIGDPVGIIAPHAG